MSNRHDGATGDTPELFMPLLSAEDWYQDLVMDLVISFPGILVNNQTGEEITDEDIPKRDVALQFKNPLTPEQEKFLEKYPGLVDW